MTSMTKNCSQFLKLSSPGTTTLKVPPKQSMSSWTTKTWNIFQQQNFSPAARSNEYLSQFNLIIRFCPSQLGAKPDALTRQWDVYPKEGESDYATINPHNLRPVFTTEQLITSLWAMSLYAPVVRATMIMDVDRLYSDI